MTPGRDWIVADIDDDAIAAAESAAQAAALPVDQWMRRAIVETYRREALTPPTAVNAATRPPPEPVPRAPLEPMSETKPEPAAAAERVTELASSSAASPSEPTQAPPTDSPARPPADAASRPLQPYHPISQGTARAVNVGRLAVGFLLLVVVSAIAWNTQDLWRGSGDDRDGAETAKGAEPGLGILPTEQIPVLPAHEAPDPQETERAFAERQKALPSPSEPEPAPNEAVIGEQTAVVEGPAVAEEVETPTAAHEDTVTDPAAVPETDERAADREPDSSAVEAASADPFAADPFDVERTPETGTVSPIAIPDQPATAQPASADGSAVGSQVATRTPPQGASVEDVPESVAAFVEAAEAGDPDAQHDLALIYIQGLGVPRDPEAAAHWFGEAAQQGNANAQYNLGVMYEQGLGVPQDRIEALLLYLTAAEQGHVAAQYNAGLAYAEGNNIPRDFAEAHRWFSAAAEQGLAEAQYNLGIIYENGLGRAKDDVIAYRYYSTAAQAGHQEAARKLAAVSARLTPAQRAQAEQAAADSPPPSGDEVNKSRLDRSGIRELQRLLRELGYDTGTADGVSGGRTAAAIRAYQQSAGLLVDGKPTAALLQHLRDAAEQ